MEHFIHAFIITLLHSVWQSALLLLIYGVINFLVKGQLPTEKRNLLYLILFSQVLLSGFTFFAYTSDFIPATPFAIGFDASLLFTPVDYRVVSYFVFVVYLIIFVYKCISLLYYWEAFRKTSHTSWIKPCADLRIFTATKAFQFGIRKKVSIWYNSHITSPVTYGFLKPVILLPVALMNQLTTEEAESLILHELSHIRNNDYLLNFFLIAIESIFFFNPFILTIAANIRMEREKNCDVQVLDFKYSALTYAETLLKVALFKPQCRKVIMAAVSGNRQLLKRILFFTKEENLIFSKHNVVPVFSVLVLLIFCFNIFTVHFIKSKQYASLVYTPEMRPGYRSQEFYSFIGKNTQLDENHSQAVTQSLPLQHPIKYKQRPSGLIAAVPALSITDEQLMTEEESSVLPVSVTEPSETKEVILNEENSSGKSITKAYTMVLINGHWVAYPMWIFTESKLNKDSLQMKKDSIIKPFNIVQ